MKSRINWFFHLRSIYYLRLGWMSTHKMQCEFAQHLKKGPTVGESNTWITQKTSLRNHWARPAPGGPCPNPNAVEGLDSHDIAGAFC